MKKFLILVGCAALFGCSNAVTIEESDSNGEPRTIDEIVEDNADFYQSIEEQSAAMQAAVETGDVSNCASLQEPQFRKNCEAMILGASGDCESASDAEVKFMCESLIQG